ncbi:MAG TPA: choice-of-anchor P family protein [Nocardioidaceae bacterium]|nr:choice-of-anchor P family protein [Nocardioidaceae bacterium]
MTTRTTLLRRAAATVTAAAVALTGAAVLTATPAQAALKKIETPFVYQGSAFGTRVTVGNAGEGGLSSGRTAWSILGCTSLAPVRNDLGSFGGKVNANSMVQVGAIDSFTSSYRRPKQKLFGSRSVNKVANIVLGPQDGPRLTIRALTTRANAFNKNGRFGANGDFDLAGVKAINIAPDGSETPGPLGDLLDAIDEADNQLVEAIIAGAGTNGIDIPGLGTVYPAGKVRTHSGPRAARSNAFGIRVELENGSTVTIGRARARIDSAPVAGVFGGHAYGLEAVVADGLLGLGRTPFQHLPCIGTGGEWRTNSLAEVPQNDNLNVGALKAETFGKGFRDGRAVARTRASVSNVRLGGGALEIRGVVGQANVVQNAKGRVIRRNVNGTRIAAIIANGETHEVPAPGESLEIPGVAVIKARVRENLGKRGLRVHAVRVEMLDGTGLVLNIGTARAILKR